MGEGLGMKPLPVKVRLLPPMAMILLIVVFGGLTSLAHAQYRDNLKECYIPWNEIYFHKPTAVGNLGNITTVVDLRGFVPMLLPTDPGTFLRVTDDYNLHWYKVPTQRGLQMLYFGNLSLQDLIDGKTVPWSRQTRFLKEKQAMGEDEDAFWVQFVYTLAKNGPHLYDEFVGGGGFKAAEPTTVFFTDASVFLVLSFKFASLAGHSPDGQMLVAFEFSRSIKQYKTVYELYSTAVWNKASSEAFMKTAPIVANLLQLASQAGLF